MSLNTIFGPEGEPLTPADAKSQLRIDVSTEDSLTARRISSARNWAEDYIARALVTRTFEWTIDAFSELLYVPMPPLRSVTSIKYVDAAGVEQTLSAADYTVDVKSHPGRIIPAYGKTWPATRGHINDVTIRFRAGYATPFTVDVSTNILTAKDHPFADGDYVVLTNSGNALPSPLFVGTTYYVRDVAGDTLKLALTSGGTAIDMTTLGSGTHFLGRIPSAILDAMLLIVGELDARRENSIVGAPIQQVPLSAQYLLEPYRVQYRIQNI